ncbi:MAG TPA: PKD domain-containing protein [Bacteroidales bacterium]|nr:PKD domain-containing protein [Bacteroidales bacterium]
MKKNHLLALLLVIPVIITSAQQNMVFVSGHVTDIDLNIPVGRHTVYAACNDSLGFYSFLTDEEGYYGDTLFFNTPGVTSLHIYTFDCLYAMHDTLVTDLSAPIVADFAICSQTLPEECWASFFYYPDSLDYFTWHFVDMSYLPDGSLPDTWFWEFGDGTASGEQYPIHTFYGEGIYTVCLTITDEETSCENTACMELMILNGPSGCENEFTYTTNDGYTFAFSGSANSPNAVSYFWDFGDGTTGEGSDVTHTYPPDPPLFMYYNVCLTTFTIDSIGDSCSDISCQEVWVGWPGDCFNYFNYYLEDSLTVTFYGEAYWGGMVMDATAYTWDFGDGTTGEGQTVTHTYPPGGSEYYTVCLETIITDPMTYDTCFAESCMDVWLKDTPPLGCENYFWYEQSDTNTYTFFGEAFFNGMPFTADSYLWDFGDGTTGDGQSVTHTFTEADSVQYIVCLTTSWVMDSTLNDSCYAVSCQGIGTGGGCEDQYTLSGQVIMGNTLADICQVSLYLANPSGEMALLGVQPIDSLGQYYFTQICEGNYYLMAELMEGSSGYGNYLPTYYIDAMTWTDADMITLGEPANPYDIYLVPAGDYSPGAGEINGMVNVNNGLFKDGMPAAGVEIILMDHSEEAVEYEYSSDLGSFGFPSLGWGTYKVHAEVPGKVTDPAWITLDEQHPQATVEFMITQSEVYNTLSMDDPDQVTLSVGEVYPNPVTDVATLPVTLTRQVSFSISIYNQLGQKVWSSSDDYAPGNHLIQLNISNLNKGIYILDIGNDEMGRIVKKLIK